MIPLRLKPLLLLPLTLTLFLYACERESALEGQNAGAVDDQVESGVSEPEAPFADAGLPENSDSTEPPPPPLNLSIPSDVLDEHLQGEDYSLDQEQKLPELFGVPGAQRKTKVSTKLLLSEEAITPIDYIDGAEVSVERKFR
ncbi:MAG: hypothetical protein ACI9JM_001846 [Halioglobus sp.]|jgi:hypothetical protein